ncbi:MAG TPA: chemotaxis response regulator protein-glutamate methylesterase [Gemmataceae bacterium]|jgi:two-component system chemotaxis response regulator CheB
MSKVRVLIVDDAVVFRRAVANELSSDPALEVVGTAANGRIALARMAQVSPEVVVLDVEMPEMDGLATLAELRKTYPRLPVIMFSSLTERGAEATLDALALGATDYFTKPAEVGGLDASLKVIREQLIPKIKALGARARGQTAIQGGPCPVDSSTTNIGERRGLSPPGQARRLASPEPIEVVAIGSSTGGPNALAEVFRRLPADFPVPIVIVQHMPPMFTRLLAERLSAEFSLRVQEGASGSVLEPGHAWIAPGDYHMIVVREGTQVRTRLHQGPQENSCRPAVDVLLRSVAQTFGPHSLSVILTGMGQDGLRGCEAIREAGGQVLAQDEVTSVVWGMPGCVARAGLADRVLPLSLIGDEVLRRVQQHRVNK